MPIGGWSGWPYAIGSSMLMRNAVNEDIAVFCIFDRDYHTEEQILARQKEALDRGVRLHIWERKELENYLLVPTAIARVIQEKVSSVSAVAISARLDEICDQLRDDVVAGFADEYQRTHRAKGEVAGKAAVFAQKAVAAKWSSVESKLAVVSGKAVLSALASWSKETFGANLSARAIARSMTIDEICPEVVTVLRAIHKNTPIAA